MRKKYFFLSFFEKAMNFNYVIYMYINYSYKVLEFFYMRGLEQVKIVTSN